MSDIPGARYLIKMALRLPGIPPEVRKLLERAYRLMTREPPVRVAPRKRVKMTHAMRRQIQAMKHTDLTQHQIADIVGTRNAGRVSEVMHPPPPKDLEPLLL